MNSVQILMLASLGLLTADLAAAVEPGCRNELAMYPERMVYDTSIPDPASFLGFELGHEPVHPYKVIEYVTRLSELSDRITVKETGRSHEGYPLLLLAITSPRNHARLESIRLEHLAHADPDANAEPPPDVPVVTWLNYGVHGSESSGLDAVLPTVYHLVAGTSPALSRILEQSVILVNPIANPDGHAERVAWLDAYGADLARADRAHLEHRYSSVRTRTNHYGFDLNRQWAFVTQPEARAWAGQWNRWLPNLTLDYHEMSSSRTYYFHPGIATRTNPLVPEEAERLMARTVKRSEAYMDSERLLYFHGAGYDNFFIGKGSTFPLINGGVGVLFEAGMSKGRFFDTPNGCRSYRDNIRKHFRTGLASIESAVDLRKEYLQYQRTFFQSALRAADDHPVKAYVVSSRDIALLGRFYDVLSVNRIDVRSLARRIEIGGRVYDPADSLIVSLSQPQHRLIRSLFETPTSFEDVGFYDVSTWTLPIAFGLPYSALTARDFDEDLLGGKFRHREDPVPVTDDSAYAWVIDWERYLAPRALYAVLADGLLAKVATKPFTATTTGGPRDFAAGSIVISPESQPLDQHEIAALIRELNTLDGITIHSLSSGKSATGNAGVDLGAPSFRPLVKPEILLVSGSGIRWYDVGEIWHLLDKRMRIPVTLIAKNRLDDVDLRHYTHIVFPGGRYSRSRSLTERLETWVERGGTVIGTRQAARWLQEGLLDSRTAEASEEHHEDAADAVVPGADGWRLDYATIKKRAALEQIGGAIFEGDLDISHPLGFGYAERTIAVHKNTTRPLEPLENRYAVVLQYTADPLVSGFASAGSQQALAHTPALIAERLGDGSVVLFADDPAFRAYWYGTNKLFLNALFFSRAFERPDD